MVETSDKSCTVKQEQEYEDGIKVALSYIDQEVAQISQGCSLVMLVRSTAALGRFAHRGWR